MTQVFITCNAHAGILDVPCGTLTGFSGTVIFLYPKSYPGPGVNIHNLVSSLEGCGNPKMHQVDGLWPKIQNCCNEVDWATTGGQPGSRKRAIAINSPFWSP